MRSMSDSGPMNILHVNEDHSRGNPGVRGAIDLLCQQLRPFLTPQDRTVIFGMNSIEVPADASPDLVTVAAPMGTSRFHRTWWGAPDLPARIGSILDDMRISVAHLHGVWTAPQFHTANLARRRGVPVVVSAHGMLQDWAMAQPGLAGAVKKRLYQMLALRPAFRGVEVFHAITPLEQDALRRYFPRSRIEIIPNSLDADVVAATGQAEVEGLPERYILSLGRLHPVKGVDLLIEAFGKARIDPDIHLLISGPEQVPDYVAKLHRLARDSDKADRIRFMPPVWDMATKATLFRHALVASVPSHTEVVSLVNLEAGALGAPTITTRTTGLLDWEEGGGLLVDYDRAQLTRALEQAAGWSAEERRDRGRASLDLVRRRYSFAATAPRWMELYRELTAAA